jgi:phospholipid transport system substrate-binding protein
MNIKTMLIVPTLFYFVFAGHADAQPSVTDEVKKVVDEVVSIVSNKEFMKPGNEQKRHKALKNTIGAIFDYNEMARLSLGRNWKERTPSERKEFVQLFQDVLRKAYARKIESYNNEKIVYLNETNDGKYAEVRSKVITAK